MGYLAANTMWLELGIGSVDGEVLIGYKKWYTHQKQGG
jgi:hypothetical protein